MLSPSPTVRRSVSIQTLTLSPSVWCTQHRPEYEAASTASHIGKKTLVCACISVYTWVCVCVCLCTGCGFDNRNPFLRRRWIDIGTLLLLPLYVPMWDGEGTRVCVCIHWACLLSHDLPRHLAIICARSLDDSPPRVERGSADCRTLLCVELGARRTAARHEHTARHPRRF